ncbi:MAG: hypothetical protein KGQ41_03400 [Alphaproteobacteria bacterium]|nr:hypothetical protein [Alphaproteobacteria bacterium]
MDHKYHTRPSTIGEWLDENVADGSEGYIPRKALLVCGAAVVAFYAVAILRPVTPVPQTQPAAKSDTLKPSMQ